MNTNNTDIVYIHYGDNQFRTPEPIRNKPKFTKPYGGVWASRTEGDNTWRCWCETEEFRLEALGTWFLFKLKPGARVLELSSKDQLATLPQQGVGIGIFDDSIYWLDFEKLAEEYDAVEVTNIDELYWPLYGWDCNSILIMNPDIVEVLENG